MPTVVQDGKSDGVGILNWDGSPVVTANFSTAYISVSAIGGGSAAITVNETISGVVQHPQMLINLADNSTVSSITAVGLYVCSAIGTISYTLTGTAPTATVNLMLKR